MPRFTSLVLATFLAPLGACATGDPPEADPGLAEAAAASRARADARAADFERVIPWGSGEGAIGWRPPAEEFRGDGPSGIAIAPDGRVVVVDRLNHRLVAIDEHTATPLADVGAIAADVEHLAISDRGAVALFSPYRARARVRGDEGGAAAELAVPRGVGDVTAIALGASNRLEVVTAFQERYVLGGPAAPLAAADVLRSKREGAVSASADGPALVAVRGEDGEATVRAVRDATGDRRADASGVVARLGNAASVRLVGRTGGAIVALVEDVEQPAEALRVTRRLVVVEEASGRIAAERPLPVGTWVPRESIALGGSPASIAFMAPEEGGLRVGRLGVSRLAAAGGAK